MRWEDRVQSSSSNFGLPVELFKHTWAVMASEGSWQESDFWGGGKGDRETKEVKLHLSVDKEDGEKRSADAHTQS